MSKLEIRAITKVERNLGATIRVEVPFSTMKVGVTGEQGVFIEFHVASDKVYVSESAPA